MLQAKPKWLSEDWRVAKCDPSGETEFLLEPLSNAVATHIQGEHLDEVLVYDEGTGEPKRDKNDNMIYALVFRSGDASVDRMRFMLRGLKGVIDPDTKDPLELRSTQVKICGKDYKCLLTESLDRLPSNLYTEIIVAGTKMAEERKAEAENEDFTSDSSTTKGSTGAGTAPEKTDAPTSDESLSDEDTTEKPEPPLE